ncbi:MAG: CRTAC1 family protein [Acidobacteria bacterium]|nr:MAG: CRTAC1 family protein [Acidobacteriota bacterium]
MYGLLLSVFLLAPPLATSGTVTFREADPAQSGVTWVHNNAMSDHRYLPETEPPGVAIFDYDNDGWMDLFMVNSGTAVFFRPRTPLRHALYRNNHDGTFTDVTQQAGITADLFGMGIAVGDYDGDGNEDLFITGYEKCVLYRNNGDGTFTDVTAGSGINPPGWSTAAVWFDYNNDAKLDLYVAQFVDYSSLRTCGAPESYGGNVQGSPAQQRYYCAPRIFRPTPSHLYRNEGGGKFTDVSQEVGISDHLGKGFGIVVTDINNDGYMDLFQANDMVPNLLFVNHKGKSFEEVGLPAGVGYSLSGQARSGMGVDAADFNGDGWQDLFVSNIDQELFSIYENNGDLTFDDLSLKTGVARVTRLLSGWGLKFFDYDNDGLIDLINANGHPDDMVDARSRGVTYREPLILFHDEGNGKLADVSQSSGEIFKRRVAGRGLAVGDLNNDGYLDVLVGVNGGSPILLWNNAETKNNWLGLHLVGTTTNPSAIGAIIKWQAEGRVRSLLKSAGGSFMSSHDPRVVLGLGKSEKVDWLEIHWPAPSQRVDRFTSLPVNRYVTIVEGKGIVK